jgi:hypothetical protein
MPSLAPASRSNKADRALVRVPTSRRSTSPSACYPQGSAVIRMVGDGDSTEPAEFSLLRLPGLLAWPGSHGHKGAPTHPAPHRPCTGPSGRLHDCQRCKASGPEDQATPALVAGPLGTGRTLTPIYRSLGVVILPGEPEGIGGWHLHQPLPLQHPFQGYTLQPRPQARRLFVSHR